MATKTVSLALITVYYGGGQAFPVLPEDAVRGKVDGKVVVIGYNQCRAWSAAHEAALTSANDSV